MNNDQIKILAIESSCDETAAAVIAEENGQPVILSNIVSSQVDLHAKTGGVVPEVASRAHMEAIIPVIREALIEAERFNDQGSMINQAPNSNDHFNIEHSLNLEPWKIDHYPNVSNSLEDITHLAVTSGPGLIGSLLVGFNAAKTMAYALDKPIIPIHHIEGHIASTFAEEIPKYKIQNTKSGRLVSKFKINTLKFPALALVVSGGHTSIIVMRDHGNYEIIGETLDDAAGEAFDKVAKLLDLGYPGGPKVSKLAEQFRNKVQGSRFNDQSNSNDQLSRNPQSAIRNNQLVFPRPLINDGTFNFSFSGLKTAVLRKVREFTDSPASVIPVKTGILPKNKKDPGSRAPVRDDKTLLNDDLKAEIAAAFEDAVVDVLCTKLLVAAEKFQVNTILVAGGVSANKQLRKVLKLKIENLKVDVELRFPPLELCGDNAAMIGLAAYYHIKQGDTKRWEEIYVDSNAELISNPKRH